MTIEEILEAIANDKTMPFIHPDQLAGIVDFVIKNYVPSLPEGLDEAAREFSRGQNYPAHAYAGFKAGSEWMAVQGVTLSGTYIHRNRYTKVNVLSICVTDPAIQSLRPGEVIIQIRKKDSSQ